MSPNTNRRLKKRPPPRAIEDWCEDDEDEEIDSDDAFDERDEELYGDHFVKNKTADGGSEESGNEEDDGDDSVPEDEDEDSRDGDGGQYMLDLLDKLGTQTAEKKPKTDDEEASNRRLAAQMKESPYSASVVKPAGLTLENMMEGLKDTKGYGALAKTMKQVASKKVESTPLPRVQQERLEREVHYKAQAKKISGWTHVVQENRQAESLDFRPQERVQLTKDMMVDNFVPKTDFEKELDAALIEAGQKDEDAILKAEEKALVDDLGSNAITLEEFKKRRGQLAKMRALMFTYEQKRHKINKIKSKKYRRIRKRQRERLKEAEAEENPQVEDDLKEKEEVERIKERMTLAHKNTSKWAKRVLKRGKNVDVDTRRALSAQLKRGDDLLKKMKGESDDEDDSDEDLAETARKVLQDTEDDNNDAVQGEGLFKLAFMQRGVEKERQRAKEEARQLLAELQADNELEEEAGFANEEDEEDVDESNTRQAKKKKLKAASDKEMKKVLKDGEMVVSGLTFGNSTSLSVSGSIPVEGIDSKTSTSTTSQHQSDVSGAKAAEGGKGSSKDSSSKDKKKRKGGSEAAPAESLPSGENPESNPWMVTEKEDSTKSNKKKKLRRTVDVDKAVDLLDHQTTHKSNEKATTRMASAVEAKDNSTNDKETGSDDNRKLTALSQDELVRRAFAVDKDHAEEDFQKEKEKVKDEEEDPARRAAAAKEKDKFAAGWGSWTGAGAPPPPKKKKKRLPKKLQPPLSKNQMEPRARQDDGREHVIIRERRMKKLSNTHMLQEIPYPYSTREEYERSMMGGIGAEWNVTGAVRELTRPAIQTASGKIIQPIALTAKKRGLRQARPAAKF